MRVGADEPQLSRALLAACLGAVGVRHTSAQNGALSHTHGMTCGTSLGGGNIEVTEDDHAVTTEVTAMTIAEPGFANYQTYQVALILAAEVENVYSIYGDAGRDLEFPPAYQVAAPFGTDFGGVNPILFASMPTSQYDSWLTVGITSGDSAHKLGAIGVNFDVWSEQNGLLSAPDTGGSVFWMDADQVREAIRPMLPCYPPHSQYPLASFSPWLGLTVCV
jgi:hypothetical protein